MELINFDNKVEFHLPFLSGKGGTESVLADVLKHFPNSKVCAFEGLGDYLWIESKSNPLIFNKSKRYSRKKVEKLKRRVEYLNYLRKTESKVLICLDSFTIKMAHIARRVFNKEFKIISWLHFSLEDAEWIKKKDLILADYHLSISSGISLQLQLLGINSNRIFTIFNPFDQQEETVNIYPDITTFIYVGRLELKAQKNLLELFDSLRIIKSLNWKLEIFGTGDDLSKAKEICQQYEIFDKVVFKGWVENPWSKIESASAMVLTSKFEGFPMVIGESLSRGLPVISSDCPTGPKDIICEENGFLYSMGDNENLSAILRSFIYKKNTFDSKTIKKSISKFYSKSYYNELNMILSRILKGEL